MNQSSLLSTVNRPPSTSNFWVNVVAFLLFFSSILGIHYFYPQVTSFQIVIIAFTLMFGVLAVYDLSILKVFQRPSTGLIPAKRSANSERVIVKLIGLYGTFLLVGIAYWVIPFYQEDFYKPYFHLMKYLVPVAMMVSGFYFNFIDSRQEDPLDEYWQMGCFLTGRWQKIQWIQLKEHLLMWFIKGFFSPIMFSIMIVYVDSLYTFQWHGWTKSFLPLYTFLMDTLYVMDVSFGFLGYVLTLRLLDNHIRSTDPTVFGWMLCLACYSPFYSFFDHMGVFQYEDGFEWYQWLAFNPVQLYLCAALIIMASFVYAISTAAIGYRMSNLTYRGIITSGPYRFSKHPAYIGKLLSWWLIALPFLSVQGPLVSLKCTLALILLSIIYFLRAITEENHLSNYPEYVQYANWINRHGIFSFFTKHFPELQYSEEKSKKWKSVVWFKKMNK